MSARLSEELARFEDRRPGLARRLQGLWKYRTAFVVSLGVLSGAFATPTLRLRDSELFAASARHLLTTDGLNVYRNPELQVGPLHLVLLSPFALLADLAHLDLVALTGAGAGGVLAWAVLQVARYAGGSERRAVPCAVAFALLGPLAASGGYGHAEEVLIGLLLLASGLLCARATGPWWLAPLCIGAAADLKLWGLLGATTLLIAADLRALVRRGLVVLGCVVAAYGPFYAFGDVRTGDFAWRVSRISPSTLVLGADTAFTWTDRLAQGLIVLLVGAVVAQWAPSPGWSVPAAVVLARIVTDPLDYSYYWTPLITIALVAVWTTARHELALVVATMLTPLLCVLVFTSPGLRTTALLGPLLLGVVVLGGRAEPARPAPP